YSRSGVRQKCSGAQARCCGSHNQRGLLRGVYRPGDRAADLLDLLPRLVYRSVRSTCCHLLTVLLPDIKERIDADESVAGYTSRFFTSRAFSSMNFRRFSTSSPISVLKISSLSTASSSLTCNRVRFSGFIVVSANWSAFISPRPL